MTTREYFENVLNAHISEEMDNASKTLLRKLDEKNEKRRTTMSKEQKEAAARRELILAYLKEHKGEPMTRDQIAAGVGNGVSGPAVSASMSFFGSAVTKAEVKIDKARRVVYTYNE